MSSDYTPKERASWASLFNALLFGTEQDEFSKAEFPALYRRAKQDESVAQIAAHYRELDLPTDDPPMTLDELATIVKHLGGRASAARLSGLSTSVVRTWLIGRWPINPQDAAYLRYLAAHQTAPVARGVRPHDHHGRRGGRGSRGQPSVKTLGAKRLVRFLAERGETYKSFANLVDVTPSSVLRWLNHGGPPRARVRALIAAVTGIEPDAWDVPVAVPTPRS